MLGLGRGPDRSCLGDGGGGGGDKKVFESEGTASVNPEPREGHMRLKP